MVGRNQNELKCIAEIASWYSQLPQRTCSVPTYHCQINLPEPSGRLLEVHPAPVAPAVLLLHPEERQEGGGVTVDIELGPGHLPPVLTGPEFPLLLPLPSTSAMPQVETVDWLPVAVFVPENYQNLGSVSMLSYTQKNQSKQPQDRSQPFLNIHYGCESVRLTWSPGTLGVMLQGRLVIMPRTVSTDSRGTGNIKCREMRDQRDLPPLTIS